MELHVFGLVALMVLTAVIIQGIYCLVHFLPSNCFRRKFERVGRGKSYVVSERHMEIPMGDIERTSTPVLTNERDKSDTNV